MVVKSDDLKWIVRLIDDTDNVVHRSVMNRLKEMGPGVIASLESYRRRQKDPSVKNALKAAADTLDTEFSLEAFDRYVSRERVEDISLFEAGKLISKLVDPGFRAVEYEDLFYGLAFQLNGEISGDKTAVENSKIFSHLFYNRFHFSICDTLIASEDDGLIFNVLKRRKGNPVAVSYLYFALAQEVGLTIMPVRFSGGFLPVYVENGKNLFYINIFNKGELFSENKLREHMSEQEMEFSTSDLKPENLPAVVTVYLESLQYIYTNAKRQDKLSVIDSALKSMGSERFFSKDEETE